MDSAGKVVSKLDFQILPRDIEAIVDCQDGAIERLLMILRVKLEFQGENQDLTVKQAQLAKLQSSNPKDRSAKGSQPPAKKPAKENRSRPDFNGFKADQNLEKQLFEKSQKVTEMTAKIALLEQKLKNCEELLTIKDEKIRILQRHSQNK